MLGIEFPLLAFSHCRDVVAAVSRAGGFGVLGATAHSPESIEQELKWIDDHVDGKPYGLDVLIPETSRPRAKRTSPGKAWSSDLARASRLHQEPPEKIRHRADDDQCRRQSAAAVRRATRAGSSRGVVPAPDPPDRQRAGRAAEGDDRDGQEARRAGRGAGRRQGACAASGRGRRRYSGGAGHRGRRPLRRGFHHGAGARGARRNSRRSTISTTAFAPLRRGEFREANNRAREL